MITIDLFWVGMVLLAVPHLFVICAFICVTHETIKRPSSTGWDTYKAVVATVGSILGIALGLFLTIYFRGE